MLKKVLVPVANDSEELETVCIVDILRRAGAEVTVASVNGLKVIASRGIKLVADCLIAECQNETFDLIVLPGGMPGAEHLRDSKELEKLLKCQLQEGRLIAAICASPAVVLKHHGLLGKRRATCHPTFMHLLDNKAEINARVVEDGTLVTSQGPGTAIEFALRLVTILFGEKKAKEVAEPLVFPLTPNS